MADQDLTLRIKGDASNALSALKKLDISLVGIGVAAAATAAAVTGLTATAARMADLGDQAADVERGFNDLASASGLVGQSFLQDLQTNTDNAVSKLDLMRVTTKGLNLDLEKNGVSLSQLARDVKTFADASGKDFVQTYDGFIQALATGRTISLQTQGIILDTAKAYDDYAESVGKSADQLTENEKLIAKQQAAAAKLHENVQALSGAQENAGDAAQELNAAFSDLFTDLNIGVSESEELRDAFKDLAAVIRDTDWRAIGGIVADGLSIATTAASESAKLLQGLIVDFKATFEIISSDPFRELQQQRARLDQLKESRDSGVAGTGLGSETLSDLLGINDEIEQVEKNIRILQLEINNLADDEVVNLRERIDEVSGERGGSGIKGLTDETIKLGEEMRRTAEQFERGQLKKSIEDSIKNLNQTDFNDLKQLLEFETEKGLLAGFKKAVDSGAVTQAYADDLASRMSTAVGDEYTDKMGEAIRKNAEEQEKRMKDALESSVGFFQEVFFDAMQGSAFDFELLFKKVLSGVAAGAAGSLFPAFGAFANPQQFGQSIGTGLIGGAGFSGVTGGAAGAGLVSGGVLTAGAGIGLGFGALQGIQDLQAGETTPFSGGLVGGLINTGLIFPGALFGAGLGDVFGGKDPEQASREGLLTSIIENTGIRENGFFSLFGGGQAQLDSRAFNVAAGTSADAVALANPLGFALGGGDSKLSSDFAAIFANATSEGENFNATLLNTRALMQQLNLDGNAVKVGLIEAFDQGAISLEELNQMVAQTNVLMSDSLPAIADIDGGFELLADTIDKPKSQVQALAITFAELEEDGKTSADQIAAEFESRLGVDGVRAIEALAAVGIESSADIREALSNPDLFVAILTNLGLVDEELRALGSAAEEGSTETARQLARIGESADESRRRVRELNDELRSTPGSSSSEGPPPVDITPRGRRLSRPLTSAQP